MRIEPRQTRAMAEATAIDRLRREGARGPWLRVLEAVLTLAGPEAELLSHEERAWHSATFCGTRHVVTLSYSDGGDGTPSMTAGEAFIAALPEHEFAIPGQLVVKASITSAEHALLPRAKLTLVAELLLLDED